MKVPMVRVGVVGRQVEVGGSVLATDGEGRLLPLAVKVEPGDSEVDTTSAPGTKD